MERLLAWKQEVGIEAVAVIEARSGSLLEESMQRLLGVKSVQWMIMEAYPSAFGLQGWVASALVAVQRNGQDGFRLPLRMTDSWPGLLCSTETGLEGELEEELENRIGGAMAWPR